MRFRLFRPKKRFSESAARKNSQWGITDKAVQEGGLHNGRMMTAHNDRIMAA